MSKIHWRNLWVVLSIGILVIFLYFCFWIPLDSRTFTDRNDSRYKAEFQRYGFIGHRSKVDITFEGKKIASEWSSLPWKNPYLLEASFIVKLDPNGNLQLDVTGMVTLLSKKLHPEEIGRESETFSVLITDYAEPRYRIFISRFLDRWSLELNDSLAGRYNQIEIFNFDTKEEALNKAEKLKKKYKDAVIVEQ